MVCQKDFYASLKNKNYHDTKNKGIIIKDEDIGEHSNNENLVNSVSSLKIQEDHEVYDNENFSKRIWYYPMYFQDYILPI